MASSDKPVITKSEEEFGQKVDRCLLDSLVKVGSGVGLGIVFSVVLFRSNYFPIFFSLLTFQTWPTKMIHSLCHNSGNIKA